MTVQEMHDKFDLILDKSSTAYFTDDEKDSFLTGAQYEYIHQLLSPESKNSPRSLTIDKFPERTAQWFNALYPILQYNETALVTTGLISWAIINALATGTNKILFLGSVIDESGNEVVLSRTNNIGRRNRNDFKQPTSTYKEYTLDEAGINVLPSSTTAVNFKLSFVRKPADIDLGAGTDCELPDITHNKIVAIAAELTGIVTEQEALSVINQITE